VFPLAFSFPHPDLRRVVFIMPGVIVKTFFFVACLCSERQVPFYLQNDSRAAFIGSGFSL
jgi:hypothetical protein